MNLRNTIFILVAVVFSGLMWLVTNPGNEYKERDAGLDSSEAKEALAMMRQLAESTNHLANCMPLKISPMAKHEVYKKAVRMEAKMEMLVHLSRDGTQVKGFDSMTVWFVKDVGLVKYTERQMVPYLGAGRDRMIEITEELKEAKLQGGTQLLSSRKASTYSTFSGRPVAPKLLQVSFPPTRFVSHP